MITNISFYYYYFFFLSFTWQYLVEFGDQESNDKLYLSIKTGSWTVRILKTLFAIILKALAYTFFSLFFPVPKTFYMSFDNLVNFYLHSILYPCKIMIKVIFFFLICFTSFLVQRGVLWIMDMLVKVTPLNYSTVNKNNYYISGIRLLQYYKAEVNVKDFYLKTAHVTATNCKIQFTHLRNIFWFKRFL